jgi:trimeric autotransporter adhesin
MSGVFYLAAGPASRARRRLPAAKIRRALLSTSALAGGALRSLALAATAAAGVVGWASMAQAFECVNSSLSSEGANDHGNLNATACGPLASANGATASAFGNMANANGADATATGAFAAANGANATAVGAGSVANGATANATGAGATAGGFGAIASATSATAFGVNAVAAAGDSVAIGNASSVTASAGPAQSQSVRTPPSPAGPARSRSAI